MIESGQYLKSRMPEVDKKSRWNLFKVLVINSKKSLGNSGDRFLISDQFRRFRETKLLFYFSAVAPQMGFFLALWNPPFLFSSSSSSSSSYCDFCPISQAWCLFALSPCLPTNATMWSASLKLASSWAWGGVCSAWSLFGPFASSGPWPRCWAGAPMGWRACRPPALWLGKKGHGATTVISFSTRWSASSSPS